MDECFRAARCAVVLALLMVLGQAPLDEEWGASELEEPNEKAMTVGNSSHVLEVLTPSGGQGNWDQAQYITAASTADGIHLSVTMAK